MNGIHHIDAPYEVLVQAFGDDGTISPRDDSKSMAEWDVETPFGEVEVYDYKIGKCYDADDGLEREDITDWHVNGSTEGIHYVLDLVKAVTS